ncbi:hypothetical protein Fcan01_08779 [Folsomia candida]|uniref:Uncharacterized protein n=1 Tax=Folsomia candida TaxID=158441 RepID=A0A226EEN1_FOLCA|nr:hypothetical protein Fcan01_08779 [Folsomia candida]
MPNESCLYASCNRFFSIIPPGTILLFSHSNDCTIGLHDRTATFVRDRTRRLLRSRGRRRRSDAAAPPYADDFSAPPPPKNLISYSFKIATPRRAADAAEKSPKTGAAAAENLSASTSATEGSNARMFSFLDDSYEAKVKRSVACKDFTAASKEGERNKAKCPYSPKLQACATHKTIGSMCATIESEGLMKMNSCKDDLCICDTDYCNKGNNMNDASKLVVVTLLGVGYLVRGYFGSEGGF